MSKITFGKFELHDTFIRGTKLTVDRLLVLLAQGKTVEEVLKVYPEAKKSNINKALRYAALAVSDYESVRETEEILSDPKALKELKQAEEDFRNGNVYDWEDVKKELLDVRIKTNLKSKKRSSKVIKVSQKRTFASYR